MHAIPVPANENPVPNNDNAELYSGVGMRILIACPQFKALSEGIVRGGAGG